jgi:small multidrug resistance pump
VDARERREWLKGDSPCPLQLIAVPFHNGSGSRSGASGVSRPWLPASESPVKLYRALFALAAAYNFVFALWSGLLPHAFFRLLLRMPPPKEPAPWPLVAIAVGLFGLLYAYASFRPQRADIVVAIGLLTKVAGPLGWLIAVAREQWPVRTFPLVLLGDVIWWFPLLAYLLRRSRLRATYLAWISAAVHLLACLGLLAVAPGTELGESLELRRQWVHGHRALWSTVWMIWSVSSISLLAVCVAWTARLWRWPEIRAGAFSGCLIVGFGLLLDLCGETTQIAWAARPEIDEVGFALAVSWYRRLSPAAANGLFCAGGMMLTNLSWQVGLTRGRVNMAGMTMWIVGLLLTAAAVAGTTTGMVVTGVFVMPLYLYWATLLGWQLRKDEGST